MSLYAKVVQEFEDRFGNTPAYVVRAPGRVNLIGEHTDYNDGFVLPLAIERAVWIALQPCPERRVVAYSLDNDQTITFALANLQKGSPAWAEYLRGMAWALQEAGYTLPGWEGVIAGDVPIGAGLSSSAALELAAARAFQAVSGWPWQIGRMARISQRAENEWVGVNCGIMDQLIAAGGVAGHALLIDCRSLETRPVPLPAEAVVVVLDTAKRRGLVDSAYNERRNRCEAAARFFGVSALRDIGPAQFEAGATGLDAVTHRRARHVITENERVLQAVQAMQRGDLVELGRLMQASHRSLRDDFEVSSPELDAMVACAETQAGCYGARMTGAGFGGCAVALVRREAASRFVENVRACYRTASGLNPSIYICRAGTGAEIVQGGD